MMTSQAFIPFDEVEINYKYVVYCPISEDVLYFANDISHDTLQFKLPKFKLMVDNMKHDRLLTDMDCLEVDVWTCPFVQKDYKLYLQKYAELSTGKGFDFNDLLSSGWTKHIINV